MFEAWHPGEKNSHFAFALMLVQIEQCIRHIFAMRVLESHASDSALPIYIQMRDHALAEKCRCNYRLGLKRYCKIVLLDGPSKTCVACICCSRWRKHMRQLTLAHEDLRYSRISCNIAIRMVSATFEQLRCANKNANA